MSIIKGVLKNYHLIVMLKKYYLIVVWKSSKVIHISNFLKIENRGREKLSQKRKISRCPKSSAGRRPGARALIS